MLPTLGGLNNTTVMLSDLPIIMHVVLCGIFLRQIAKSETTLSAIEVSAILVEAKDPRAVVIFAAETANSFKLSLENLCVKFITNLVIYRHPFIHIHKIYSLSIFFFSKFPIPKANLHQGEKTFIFLT